MKLNTGLTAFTLISSFYFSAADSSASQKDKKKVHLRERVTSSSMSDPVPVQTNTDIGHYPGKRNLQIVGWGDDGWFDEVGDEPLLTNSMFDTVPVPVQPNSAAAADINTDIGHYPWGLEQLDGIWTHNGGGSHDEVVEDEPIGQLI